MTRPKDPPPLYLEKARLGELDAFERSRLEERLSPDSLRSQIETLAGADTHFLDSHPASFLTPPSRRRTAPALAGFALAAGLAGLVVLTRPMPPESDVILKGAEPGLKVYRREGAGFTALPDGDLARAGDLLQLRYRPAGETHGVIASIDGRGEVTLHFPASPDASTELARGGELPLDHSYELDDAPRFERFVFVTDEGSVSPNVVLDALRALPELARDTAPLAIPSAWQQHDISVRKPE